MTNAKTNRALIEAGLKKRYRKERFFKAAGIFSIVFGLSWLALLFGDIITKGTPAFKATMIQLQVDLDEDTLGIDAADPSSYAQGSYDRVLRNALREQFAEVKSRRDRRSLYRVMSSNAGYDLRDIIEQDPSLINTTTSVWVKADSVVDDYFKNYHAPQKTGHLLTDKQLIWVNDLIDSSMIEFKFNTSFFTSSDSRDPESAGVAGALKGSVLALFVTLVLAFPIAIAAAVYLEEFAPKNSFTDIIEVNINNLAAVPSIIFGLLGLAIFLNIFGMPRSAPLLGGMVLALMTLPTIIISARAAIKAVPPSIREAAYGLGASKMQVVLHHVIPLAMPGMLTGAIIGIAQALGETAPLLMIGMVAFIVDIPQGITDPATVLPVQIYLWSDSPERGFVANTSAAIMVLLGLLITMNLAAVMLRKRLEKRW